MAEEKRWANEHDAKLLARDRPGKFQPAAVNVRRERSEASNGALRVHSNGTRKSHIRLSLSHDRQSESGHALRVVLEKHSVAFSSPNSLLFKDLLELFTMGANGARR